MKYILLILTSLAIAIFLEAYALSVQAQTSSQSARVIAVLPNPSEDDRKAEWIEIYNFGSAPIDLMQYSLQVGENTPKQISLEPLSLPSRQKVLLVRNAETVQPLFPEALLVTFSFSLANRPTKIILSNNGTKVDELEYSNTDSDIVTFTSPCNAIQTSALSDFDLELPLVDCIMQKAESIPIVGPKPAATPNNNAALDSLYMQILKEIPLPDINSAAPIELRPRKYLDTGTIPKHVLTWGQVVAFVWLNTSLLWLCYESRLIVQALEVRLQKWRHQEKNHPRGS